MKITKDKLKQIIKEELQSVLAEREFKKTEKRFYRLVDQPEEEQAAYRALMKLFKDERSAGHRTLYDDKQPGMFQDALLAAAAFGWKFTDGLRAMDQHENQHVRDMYQYIKKTTKGMKPFDRMLRQK